MIHLLVAQHAQSAHQVLPFTLDRVEENTLVGIPRAGHSGMTHITGLDAAHRHAHCTPHLIIHLDGHTDGGSGELLVGHQLRVNAGQVHHLHTVSGESQQLVHSPMILSASNNLLINDHSRLVDAVVVLHLVVGQGHDRLVCAHITEAKNHGQH